MWFKKTESLDLVVAGMTCHHCEMAVEKALKAVPGVSEAKASAAEGKASVKVEAGKLDRAALERAIEDAGYEVAG